MSIWCSMMIWHQQAHGNSMGLCNIRCPPETHLHFKSRESSFFQYFLFSCPIVLKFCTKHGSTAALLCVQFQNDWVTRKYVMAKRDFTRFGVLKRSFGRIFYIAQPPWFLVPKDLKTNTVSLTCTAYFVLLPCIKHADIPWQLAFQDAVLWILAYGQAGTAYCWKVGFVRNVRYTTVLCNV